MLESAIKEDTNSRLERAGLIQFFEMSFELAWKVLKDYLEANGTEVIDFNTIDNPKRKEHILGQGKLLLDTKQ